MAKKKKSSAPPQATPIDYGQMMGQASEAAKLQFRDQIAAQIESYPKQEALQLGTIQKVADNLGGNEYTQRSREQLLAAGAIPGQIGTLADRASALSEQASADLQGTDIERELQRQAVSDLQLGRSLNAEEERAATQQARAGMSARGLGTGTGALAAEVLNRDAYAQARESARRNFAGSANQMIVSNRNARLGLASDLIGQTGSIRMNQAGLAQNLAASNIAADPYMRAFAPGTSIGGGTLSTGASMIGNTYNSANQMAGNVASFNANMLDSRYNSYMNNQAALRGAAMQAGATAGASQNSMMGSGMAAGGMVLGMTALAI